jgi:hypothetical protein
VKNVRVVRHDQPEPAGTDIGIANGRFASGQPTGHYLRRPTAD